MRRIDLPEGYEVVRDEFCPFPITGDSRRYLLMVEIQDPSGVKRMWEYPIIITGTWLAYHPGGLNEALEFELDRAYHEIKEGIRRWVVRNFYLTKTLKSWL